MLTREQLDAAPCSTPGCQRKAGDCGDGFVLAARCHRTIALHVTRIDNIVTIACAECLKLVTEIGVTGPDVELDACHNSAVNVTYTAGILVTKCAQCSAVVAELPVLASTDPH